MTDHRVALLNYHRVVPDGGQTEFYDVTESEFEAQMTLLVERRAAVSAGATVLGNGLTIYITFDDGTADHHRAGRLLEAMGLSGVFFVVSGKLDTDGRLTSRQLLDLAGAGHRIGSHTVTHARLPETSDRELQSELVGSKQHLERLVGTTVDWLAPPGGLFDDRVLAAARRAGYTVVRTMQWGYASQALSGRVPALPVLPSYDRAGFVRLLEGRAPLWRYHLKTGLKRTVGEDRYVRLRNSSARWLRGRRG